MGRSNEPDVGRGYLAMGCSKCSASRRQPPSRLISTSPVGFVHRTCRPSGPTQQLTMVSSTSATCNATLADPTAAMARKVRGASGRGRWNTLTARKERGVADGSGRGGEEAARGGSWASFPSAPSGVTCCSVTRDRRSIVCEAGQAVRTSPELFLERKLPALPLVPG